MDLKDPPPLGYIPFGSTNDCATTLRLPRKPDGSPYYLMDLIEYSGIDLKEPKGRVKLTVNGRIGMFQQALSEGDSVQIEEEQEE